MRAEEPQGPGFFNRREILRTAGLGVFGEAGLRVAGAPVSALFSCFDQVAPPTKLSGRVSVQEGPSVLSGSMRTGVQNFLEEAPSDVFAGPVVMNGQVVHRAMDGSWIKFRAQSNWGSFTYLITRLGAEPGALRSIPGTPNTPSGAVIGREIHWADIQAGSQSSLWLDGDITETRAEGAELEGRFAFSGEVVRLRFVLVENNPLGADPVPTSGIYITDSMCGRS
jgi:hypothetical protein